jgi:hypothetical protein
MSAMRDWLSSRALAVFSKPGVSMLTELARTGGFSVTTNDRVGGMSMSTTVTLLGDVTVYASRGVTSALQRRHALAVEQDLLRLKRAVQWLAKEAQGASWIARAAGIVAGGGALGVPEPADFLTTMLQDLVPLPAGILSIALQAICAIAAYGVVNTAGQLLRRALIVKIRARLQRLMP